MSDQVNASRSQPVLAETAIGSAETSAVFTPGPWTFSWVEVGGSMIEPYEGFLVWPAAMNSLQAIMSGEAIASPWGSRDDEVAEANARLVAHAPALLEAAWCLAMASLQSRRYAEDSEYRDAVDVALDCCRSALGEPTREERKAAKATGGQP